MAGRGAQTFKKRQKEQQRKEKQQEKAAKRLDRKQTTLEASTEELQQDVETLGDMPVDTEDAHPA
jgi:hypothetical protein